MVLIFVPSVMVADGESHDQQTGAKMPPHLIGDGLNKRERAMKRHINKSVERTRRREMMQAIQEACDNHEGSSFKNKVHPINGLRIIREFERLNGIPFDPFNRLHRYTVYGMRPLIVLRKIRKNLKVTSN